MGKTSKGKASSKAKSSKKAGKASAAKSTTLPPPPNSGDGTYELQDGQWVKIDPHDPNYVRVDPWRYSNPANLSPEQRKQMAEMDAKTKGNPKFGQSPTPVILPPLPRHEVASTAATADAETVSQLDVAKELSKLSGRPIGSCKATVSRAVKDGDLKSNGLRGKACRIEKPNADAWLKRQSKKTDKHDDINADLEIT